MFFYIVRRHFYLTFFANPESIVLARGQAFTKHFKGLLIVENDSKSCIYLAEEALL